MPTASAWQPAASSGGSVSDFAVVQRGDPNFYALVGPFLCRRYIVRETGHPMWDDPEKVWVVRRGGGAVAAWRAHRGVGCLCSAYVLQVHRGKGVYRRMVELRERLIVEAGLGAVAAVCTPASADRLARWGYEQTGTRGSYRIMRRTL